MAKPGVVTLKQLQQLLWEECPLVISRAVVRTVLRQAGFTWRRVRKSLKSQRDEQLYRLFQQEIKHLRVMEATNEIDLWPPWRL